MFYLRKLFYVETNRSLNTTNKHLSTHRKEMTALSTLTHSQDSTSIPINIRKQQSQQHYNTNKHLLTHGKRNNILHSPKQSANSTQENNKNSQQQCNNIGKKSNNAHQYSQHTNIKQPLIQRTHYRQEHSSTQFT